MERLIGLYREQRNDDESPVAFFRRVDLAAVKSGARAISRSSIRRQRLPEDFIDLAEDHAFEPEVQEGECSA